MSLTSAVWEYHRQGNCKGQEAATALSRVGGLWGMVRWPWNLGISRRKAIWTRKSGHTGVIHHSLNSSHRWNPAFSHGSMTLCLPRSGAVSKPSDFSRATQWALKIQLIFPQSPGKFSSCLISGCPLRTDFTNPLQWNLIPLRLHSLGPLDGKGGQCPCSLWPLSFLFLLWCPHFPHQGSPSPTALFCCHLLRSWSFPSRCDGFSHSFCHFPSGFFLPTVPSLYIISSQRELHCVCSPTILLTTSVHRYYLLF